MEARFWKGRERDIAIERLRANQTGIISRKWRWDHVLEALLDLKTWGWFFLVMGISYVLSLPERFLRIGKTNDLQNPIGWNRYLRTLNRAIIRFR